MGRNRKNVSTVRFVPAMKAVLICVLIGGSAIGYVFQKNQIIELGRQMQKREQHWAQLRASNIKLQQTLLTLQSTYYLEQRVKQLKLDLAPPVQAQILTIVEVPAAAAAPKSQPLFAEMQAGRRALQ